MTNNNMKDITDDSVPVQRVLLNGQLRGGERSVRVHPGIPTAILRPVQRGLLRSSAVPSVRLPP